MIKQARDVACAGLAKGALHPKDVFQPNLRQRHERGRCPAKTSDAVPTSSSSSSDGEQADAITSRFYAAEPQCQSAIDSAAHKFPSVVPSRHAPCASQHQEHLDLNTRIRLERPPQKVAAFSLADKIFTGDLKQAASLLAQRRLVKRAIQVCPAAILPNAELTSWAVAQYALLLDVSKPVHHCV